MSIPIPRSRPRLRLTAPSTRTRPADFRDQAIALGSLATSIERVGEATARTEAARRQRAQAAIDAAWVSEREGDFVRQATADFSQRMREDDATRPGFVTEIDQKLEAGIREVTSVDDDTDETGAPSLGGEQGGPSAAARVTLGQRLNSFRTRLTGQAMSAADAALTAKATLGFTQELNQMVALTRQNPDAAGIMAERLQHLGRQYQSALPNDALAKLMQAGQGQLLRAEVEGLVKQGDFEGAQAVLHDSASYKAMTPDARATLDNKVIADYENHLREGRLAADRERVANERLQKARAEAAMKDITDAALAGTLSAEMVDAARDDLNVSQYQAALSLMRQPAEVDDVTAVRDLETELGRDAEEAGRLAAYHLSKNNITVDYFQDVTRRANDRLRAAGPPPPYDRGREYIAGALTPSPFIARYVDENRALAEARVDYDLAVESRQPQSPSEYVAIARDVVNRVSENYWTDAVQNVPQPRFFPVSRQADDVELMRQELSDAVAIAEAKLGAGEISQGEFREEVLRLDIWQSILSAMRQRKARPAEVRNAP